MGMTGLLLAGGHNARRGTAFRGVWRMGRDSNPRNLAVRHVSSVVVSTSHPPIRITSAREVRVSASTGPVEVVAERARFELAVDLRPRRLSKTVP